MIQLPQACYCSAPKVKPRNWLSQKASCKKEWYVYYRFYDPQFKSRFPKGKLVIVKGMNHLKTAPERKAETQSIIRRELDKLHAGYNPVRGLEGKSVNCVKEVDPFTPFIRALHDVKERVKGASTTHRDLRSIIGFIADASEPLHYTDLPVNSVRRKHIKTILQQIEVHKGESPHRYNKVRSYLMILFNELVELEAVEANPVKDVAKQKHCQKLRRVLTREQREQVNNYLKAHHYRFWLFLHIFFHSGARLTEIIEIQRKNIHLEQHYFVVTVRKGRQAKEVVKPIKDVALSFWTEAVQGASGEDYIFSKGLCVGNSPVKSYQITKRWNRHIKKKLGIDIDFYSLKHLNLDETSSLLNIEAAAAMASHASSRVTARHYAVGEYDRQIEKLKQVRNSFV